MKVSGEGKVHANILRRNLSGYLTTEVAGFAKLASSISDDLYGALLSVSESITSYVRSEVKKYKIPVELLSWLQVVGWGGTVSRERERLH